VSAVEWEHRRGGALSIRSHAIQARADLHFRGLGEIVVSSAGPIYRVLPTGWLVQPTHEAILHKRKDRPRMSAL
jgi:hypothetical protein